MATYRKTSPYFTTKENSLYLELLSLRPVAAESDDQDYIIENGYKHRPDLLAFDLYGDAKLWWVLVLRNRSILKDPIYDFIPGVTIKLPKKTNVDETLATTKSN